MAERAHRLPYFDLKEKSYESYRFELECWLEVTSVDKKKQGIEILLSLPESNKDEFKTREYLTSKLTKEQLTGENGAKNIIEEMDNHLRGDDLGRLWESFVEFDTVNRSDMTISEYISKFDIIYNKLEKSGKVKIPESVLGLLLIRRANLSSDEAKMAMTGLDYNRSETLYSQAKCSLRKFAGETLINSSNKGTAGEVGLFAQTPSPSQHVPVQVKQESVNITENDAEVYASYRGGYPSRRWNRGFSRSRGTGYARGQRGKPRYGDQMDHNRDSGDHTNPKNRFGDYLRCHFCGSFRHLQNKCPESRNGSSTSPGAQETTQFTVLFTGNVDAFISELSNDAENCAILDSACSSTVCGVTWLQRYVSSLSEDKRKLIIQSDSSQSFKFGGGEKLVSVGLFTIPAKLAGEDIYIRTDVVESDIPLLLSLDSMKKADIVLYTKEDKATAFGKEIDLNFTSSGHYCVSLVDDTVDVSSIQEVLRVELGEIEIEQKLLHLHRQFAHPSSEKLTELLKNANSWKPDYKILLEKIVKNCDICKKFKKNVNRPVVAMPMATRFNQCVTMDLKKWKNCYIVYFIDFMSRLCIARKIMRKLPGEVVQAFMSGWLASGYGIPEEILVDNGGEFTAEEIKEFTSILNIKVNTTASHSPFSNGLCERNHAVMDSMLEKLEYEHPNTPLDDLISWACAVKNSMSIHAGYSPFQIVFGVNPTLPGFDCHPPSTNSIKGDMLRKHLQALASARKAFVEADCSEKIRRALRHKIRVVERDYNSGDLVYYKRDGTNEWLGPAKVVVQDGKVVFIRHGSYLIRVYKTGLF